MRSLTKNLFNELKNANIKYIEISLSKENAEKMDKN